MRAPFNVHQFEWHRADGQIIIINSRSIYVKGPFNGSNERENHPCGVLRW